MAENLSEEDIISYTEILKQRFLQEHGDSTEMDARDIDKVHNDPHCVVRFVRHNRGNLDTAYTHMVECFKWRKSFGLNDVQWDDIDEALWKSGMAWNRGYDKDGNNVCILNINLHRKDSKKATKLQQWIAFSFEMQRKVYPTKKMCMIFDMSGAGLAQMDMDLVRFVINSFKIYFPDMLAWLLVFNMPWVLQAAWKIVQSWLSEGAVAKVKFVTKDNIGEYIPSEQRLVKFGGTDTWVFEYQVERDRMFKLATEASNMENDGGDNDDLFQDQEDSITTYPSDRSRQVHFSSGLPPTRQSRFGYDDDVNEKRSISPQQKLLQQGSSTSRGIRRRQVSKLMSLQESKQEGPQRSASVDEGSESLPLNIGTRRHSAHPSFQSNPNGAVGTIGDVILSPSTELTFIGKKDTEISCTLTLTNTSDNCVLYKIKTTAPVRYKVRPNVAMVDGKSVAKVQVMFTPGYGKTSVSQDKFLVQTYTFSSDSSLPDIGQLIEFWKALSEQDIKEHRMHCRLLSDAPPKPALKEPGVLKDTIRPLPLDTNLTLKALELKVISLTIGNAELAKNVNRLLTLIYIIIIMLVLVLAYKYLF